MCNPLWDARYVKDKNWRQKYLKEGAEPKLTLIPPFIYLYEHNQIMSSTEKSFDYAIASAALFHCWKRREDEKIKVVDEIYCSFVCAVPIP